MPNQSAPRLPAEDASLSLLPRRLIFGDPERSIVRISPDGTRIASVLRLTVCSTSGLRRWTG